MTKNRAAMTRIYSKFQALLILFVVLVPCRHYAQNWNPLPSGQTLLFQYRDIQNNRTGFMAAKCDSVLTEGQDTAFYLFKMDKIASGSETATGCMGQSLPVSIWAERDHFLGKKMLMRPDGEALFISSTPDTFRVMTRAAQGDSWIWKGVITATVTAITQEPVLGQIDSLKYISLSNGSSMILGKNSGFVKVYPIFETPSQLQNGRAMHLWGMPERGLGGSLPGFGEVFGFDVGDEFGRIESSSVFPFGGSTEKWNTHYRIDSINAAGNDRSYDVWIEQTKTYTSGQWGNSQEHFLPQTGVVTFDSAALSQVELLPYQHRRSPYPENSYFQIHTGSFRWSLDTNRIMHRFDFGFVLDTCSGAYYYDFAVYGFAEYVSGIGLWRYQEDGFDWSEYKSVTCFHTQEGDYQSCPAFTVVSSPEPEVEGLAVYPNPATSDLNVVFSDDTVARRIVLYQADGARVFWQSYGRSVEKVKLDVSGFRPGLYLLKIEEDGRQPTVKRVMVGR